MSELPTKRIIVFLDTGLQKVFVPLRKSPNFTELPNSKVPESLKEALKEIEPYKEFSETTKDELDEIFKDEKNWEIKLAEDTTFWKARFGRKTWHLEGGINEELEGIWFMIETNTSAQDANKSVRYDRGCFYQTNGLSEKDKKNSIDAYEMHIAPKGGKEPYIHLHKGDQNTYFLTDKFIEVDLSPLKIELAIRVPNGDFRDVDVVLDLGNTRTAGLLFEHAADGMRKPFSPCEFKQKFKILRIKPDPASGEYDSLEDVEAGIAQSWFVVHQLDHQKYLGQEASKKPSLLVTEYRDVEVKTVSKGFIFKTTKYEVQGKVCERIPQMFMQLSPILLGDQAEREFNLPYAKAMASVGARLQQSSPKRYYWDDSTAENISNWNMLLNRWDASYDETPKNSVFLPTLQSEMLRFMNEDGSILDLKEELEPCNAPTAYPENPRYPRQSTLTWFLLHILERAYAQTNSAFSAGADFIPHRLRKVLITYPSGWTNDEVDGYHKRCREALDIFSQTNVYHGVMSPLRVEMIPRDQTPDEAVAGQLPFIFSEINRYPGVTAAKWIALAGKKRQGVDSIRIMNFDIGGGTSDISVIEYRDSNQAASGVAQNLLSTSLLFKDGQANAGDDLLKKIIEKIILGGLLRTKKTVPGLADSIIRCFTQPSTNKKVNSIRSRIVRTCLIPLATTCLSRIGEEAVQFSAKDAKINQNNWAEFLEFIGSPEQAIPWTQTCFSCSSTEVNELIEAQFAGLFQNCAMYAAAYDVDMLIFSGKPSELPHIKTMAKQYIPLDENRMIFARDFKPGDWYPFTDAKGYIEDAKTVTVVGSALYYALSNGFITGWKIKTSCSKPERNEWGDLKAMKSAERAVFLPKTEETVEVTLLPNTSIARRQNICSSPEPVYRLIAKTEVYDAVKVRLARKMDDGGGGEKLEIRAIDGSQEKAKDFKLKLCPCEDETPWLDSGIFKNLEGIESC